MVRSRVESVSPLSDLTEIMGQEETSALPDEHMLPEGVRIGDHVVERVLGRGGGGAVYAARHSQTGARVAIKVLRPDMAAFPVMIARFSREIEALQRLAHPNIVSLLGYGEITKGRPYYVMELVDGIDLRGLLSRHGRLTPAEVLELMTPICEAVAAAHQAGIVHRDLKANNVIVLEREGRRAVKLLDFGIAKLLEHEGHGQGLTEPGAVIGSAHTMAPEQVRCEAVDERTDVYALGVLLFQLLTGQFPFQADDLHRVALLHLTAPAPRPSVLAPGAAALDPVVLRCLEKQRDLRFESASELLQALRRAVGDTPPTRATSAQALALEVRLGASGDDEELDDAELERLLGALDELEHELQIAGCLLPLRTSSLLLAVRVLAAGDEAAALAAEIAERLHATTERHELAITSRWHTGEVELASEGGRLEVVGGELLNTDAWPERGTGAP